MSPPRVVAAPKAGPRGALSPGSLPSYRVAAIDVGSNAIRYLVAEVSASGTHAVIEAERLAVRLGRDVFTRERRLSAETMDAGVSALTLIRRRIDDLGITHYRAVATSAVRESRNGGEFVERVRRESGIHLETISGSEEARLVWIAVRERIDFGSEHWLMMDLGGGSVEVSVVGRDGMVWTESHTLGSVRLLQALEEDGPSEDEPHFYELLERYVHVLRVPRAVAEWEPAGTIATGGNIESLASLANGGWPADEVCRLRRTDLRAVIDRLASLSYAERVRHLDLREDRADVILPAAVVYERIAEVVGAEEILVPAVGVKEGLVLDLADELDDQRAHRDREVEEIRAAAITLGRRYQFDEVHGKQVARLSLELFDQLDALHELEPRNRNLLLAGALLHDIGQFISYRGHHKHSMYLIENSELPELSPAELRLVALLARYHRRAEPKQTHPGYQELGATERERVRRLAAILRVADALDREHVCRVERIRARIEEDVVTLRLRTRGRLTLEEWALRKKGKLFDSVFRRLLRIEAEVV